MLACQNLGLSATEADDFAAALRPLLGDFGFELLLSAPERWYLRLPEGAIPPEFSAPGEVLGADIAEHLPTGAAGRRWRHLLNEIQIALHPHRRNAERSAGGRLPVNSLWFWGGGKLPNRVRSEYQAVLSSDPLLAGLARLASVTRLTESEATSVIAAGKKTLVDLRSGPEPAELMRHWIDLMVQALRSDRIASLRLYFADGPWFVLERRQRWRFWRRALGHGMIA